MQFSEEGHPYLHHENERLIVAGDSNDRGKWSVPISYLMASSFKYSPEKSVIPTMGNHCQRFIKWARNKEYYDIDSTGWAVTLNQLRNPFYSTHARLLEEVVPFYPYWYVSKSFIAVHAYWKSPLPTEELAMRGPYEDRRRVAWWNLESRTGQKPVIFGHYHAQMNILFPEKNIYCIDNHDVGVFTYALSEDDRTVQIREWEHAEENPLLDDFYALTLY